MRKATAPSTALLAKVAAAEGVTIADIMAYAHDPEHVPVSHVVISGGRIVVGNSTVKVARPQTIDPSLELDACEVAGDGMHPVPAGWIVFFATIPRPAAELVGQLCVVRVRGDQDAVVATVRAGRAADVFDLEPWHGSVRQGVQILAAHRVEVIQPPPEK